MAKSASPSPAPSTPEHFEDALRELERVVADMEQGELPLEVALARYQRGVALLKFCQDRLNAAEQTVRLLEGDLLQPFAAAGETDPGEDD